ncbi:uncharacterized protein LOC144660796 isoform X2 [Oculina patagonica]
MADVVIRSCGLRAFLPSCCRAWSGARHLRTAADIHKAFGTSMVKLNTREKFTSITKGCASCTKIRKLSSPSGVALPSQVVTAKSSEVQKSKKYQPLHVMPFSLTQGGKCVAHVLQKYKPKRALVFVRAKVLAVELAKELEEYGLKCSLPKYEKTADNDAESDREAAYMYSLYPVTMDIEAMDTEAMERQSVDRQPTDGQSIEGEAIDRQIVDEQTISDTEPSITVLTEDDVQSMEELLPVDLIVLVQQPMSGRSFTLFCLKKTHAKVKPLDVVLLYGHNDVPYLREMQTYVDVRKLVPPSFYGLSVMTEGLPSVQEETVVTPGRHLIEPPPPPITATIPPKLLPFKKFQPPVPVPTKRPERHGLDDRARIYVRGGGGGQGSPRFGGMGGDGGDVVVQCLPYGTLSHFTLKENRRIIAEHGTSFRIDERGRKHRAIRGRDVVIPVPVGTTLSTDDGRLIGELEEEGAKIVVAKGGRGGSAATVNWCGEKGERDIVRLEMRLHSDIALVGFPNAGKSTLLGAISNASPKTADYAFTTMRPSIGMVEYSDHSQVRVADLPGLIEGASINKGLGHAFLKHTEKAKALALVVDIDGFHFNDKFPARTAFENVCILLKELFLYKRELLNRPKMLIVTKLDKKGATSRFQSLRHKLDSIQQHETLLSVLQEISSNSPTAQENTNLMELTEELARTSFDSIVPFSAVTSFGLEDVRDKIKELT